MIVRDRLVPLVVLAHHLDPTDAGLLDQAVPGLRDREELDQCLGDRMRRARKMWRRPERGVKSTDGLVVRGRVVLEGPQCRTDLGPIEGIEVPIARSSLLVDRLDRVVILSLRI